MKILELAAPFQTGFYIKTDCDNFIDTLYAVYGSYITESEQQNTLKPIISVIKDDIAYTVVYDNNAFKTERPLQEISRILFENTVYDAKVFALHGAALERNGQAYLFLASTTSGKTTLASYLSSNGFGYITDDCILLDKDTFQIYPYHTPMHIRDGGINVLQKYGCIPENLVYLDDNSYQRFIYMPDNCMTHPVPLAKIFFITRTEDKNLVEKMNMTQRMTGLLKAPITNYRLTTDYIRSVAFLAQKDCFRLYYCDMRYVKELIQNE